MTDQRMARQIEGFMGDLVDLLAAHPSVKIDDRAWSQLLIYAPKSADQSTDRAIKLVQALMNEKPWCDQQWARCALAIAASAIQRGRLWTEDEKLENLAKAMEEDDPDWTPDERAANHETAERLRMMISKGASATGNGER